MKNWLLLHGALGASTQLEPLKKRLEEKGLRVFAMDFSGHRGLPDAREGFGIEAFAQDVVRFLDAHQLDQVNIFGYSMGGYVALWFALNHPTRVHEVVTLGTKFDWSPESAEKEIKKMDPVKVEEKIPAFARILEARHKPNDWKELMHKTARMMRGLGNLPLLTEANLKSCDKKVTVLLGDADDMADRSFSQQVARWMVRGHFVLLAETGHPIEKVDLDILVSHLIGSS